MKTLNMTKRTYRLAIADSGEIDTIEFSLKALLDPRNDYEYAYALQDEIDRVLDMKTGESIYIQPNRDRQDSKGILQRLS